MTEQNEAKRLSRNNILLAIALGIVAILGVFIPYFYLSGAVAATG